MKLKKVLRAVCFWCSCDLLTEKQKSELSTCKSKEESFSFLIKCSSFKKHCTACSGPQPTINYKGNDICFDFDSNIKDKMNPDDLDYLNSFNGVFSTQKVFEILRDINVEFEEQLHFKKKALCSLFDENYFGITSDNENVIHAQQKGATSRSNKAVVINNKLQIRH